jgi:hypothetical protein
VPTYTFEIGRAFPADDPVARFVTVLAMMSNDWKRTMQAMMDSLEKPDDGEGTRLMHFRQLVGYSHEATKFLRDSPKRYAEIASFIERLDGPARAQYDNVFAALIGFEAWMREQRDVTFHYPEMVRESYLAGDEAIANALAASAEHGDTSAATIADTLRDVRFDFADAVAVHLLGFDFREGNEEMRRPTVALREAQYALALFAYAAVGAYLRSRPPGIVQESSGDAM